MPPGRFQVRLMGRTTLIKGGHIISMDDTLGDLLGDVLIEDDRIADVAPSIDTPADETIDAAGSIVIPGMIDMHIHLWQTCLAGIAAGCWGTEYFGLVHPMSARIRAEDMYWSTFGGAKALLRNGITTTVDFCHATNSPEHAERAVDALVDAGLRGYFGFSFRDRPEVRTRSFGSLESRIDSLGELVSRTGTEGRVRVAASLNNTEHISPEEHAREIEAARELGLPSAVHFNVPGHVLQTHEQGLLGDDIMWVHCGPITDQELGLLAEHGGAVIACPELESHQAGITPKLGSALRHGVPAGVGIDTVVMCSPDLFTTMRAAHAIDHFLDGFEDRIGGRPLKRRPGTPLLNSHTMLELYTTRAARILHQEDRIGSLTPGKQADVTVISTEPYGLAAATPVDHVIFQASSRDVDTVIVDGVVQVRGGRFVDLDTAEMRRRLDEGRDWILGRVEGTEWVELTPAEREIYEANFGKPVAT